MEKICLLKSDEENQTFNYTWVFRGIYRIYGKNWLLWCSISATNNSRRYNGTTFYESNDPHVQRIHLDDGSQRNDTYEINFTDEEVNSNDTFCKGISKILSGECIGTYICEIIYCCFERFPESGILGAYPVSNINPNLLKSLAGWKCSISEIFIALFILQKQELIIFSQNYWSRKYWINFSQIYGPNHTKYILHFCKIQIK